MQRNKLTAAEVKSLPSGLYGDGAGLWLKKQSANAGQWFVRISLFGTRREMGLGGINKVSLKEARQMADDARRLARDGIDPVSAREVQRIEAKRDLRTFQDVALDAFEARKAELRGDGKAGRWLSPLEVHVFPRLGSRPIAKVNQIDLRDVLAPLWHTKADVARKALNRTSLTFKHAAALGLGVDLTVPEKTKALLGKSRHMARNIPAMNWRDVPAFYDSLSDPTITHLALRLTILTGLRSKPIRFAHESQFDGAVWTVPADLMKGREGKTEPFRVPLSGESLHVIELAKQQSRDGFLFPSVRKGVISDATMSRLMERRGLEARPHGFRSSLRVWLTEAADAPRDLSEMILGHKVGSDVERAYDRSDQLERRAVLLERWANHVVGGTGKVVLLSGDSA